MTGLRPALRLARRDVRRSPGRSLLIVLMVALPVSGAAFIDVVLRTADVRGTERIALELGRTADARVVPGSDGSAILQRPDETYGQRPAILTGPGETPPVAEQLPPTDPLPLLPEGSRSITDSRVQVTVRTERGQARATFRELDIADPLAQGLYELADGRAPATPDEVAVTTALLERLGRSVGDELEVLRPERTLEIVGTVRPTSDRLGTALAVSLPRALGDLDDGRQAVREPLGLLVDTPTPVGWPQVLALNEVGVAVFSRAVVEDPPAPEQVPLLQQEGFDQGGSLTVSRLVPAVLVVGLAVAEVALLAGAAFAVGIRRQGRVLGLLAATGGSRRQVRAVVLGQGAVLGATGGLAGVAVGTLAGLAGLQVASVRFDRYLPAPDVRPLELLALTLIGVLTGVLAAWVPARTAARQDVVAALTGRRGVVRTRRRYPVVGLVTAALGAALALGGGALALATEQSGSAGDRLVTLSAGAILLGAVLTQLGLVVATPALVGGAARLGRFLPLAPRLALRDAARHRGRSAPAIAAVLAAVSGSVALSLFVASMSDKDEREYVATAGYGHAVLRASSFDGTRRDTAPLVEAVRRIAPPDDVIDVRSFPFDPSCATDCRSVEAVSPPDQRCPAELLGRDGRQPTQEQLDEASADPRCSSGEVYYGTPYSGPVVGSYDDLVRLTGLRSEPARAALDAGGMVVFDDDLVSAGRGALEVSSFDAATGTPGRVRQLAPAAVLVLPPANVGGLPNAFLSPELAEQTGVPVGLDATVLAYDVPPDDGTEEAISAALAELGEEQPFQVERGYRDAYGIGLLALLAASTLVTLGAAGVATGLAQADARADHATLAAVGASPRLRRRLTAAQAVVVAGLGALLGTVSGFVPMAAFLYADGSMRFVAPWRNLVAIAVVVPAVAALAAFALTRSRLPLTRRTA